MAGFDSAAVAGAALAGGDVFEVESNDHILPLEGGVSEEAEVGQLFSLGGNQLEGAREVGFEQVGHLGGEVGFGLLIFGGRLEGGGHADDGGEVFGAGAAVTFLGAAKDLGLEFDFGLDHQRACAAGAAEFVGGEGEHIDA